MLILASTSQSRRELLNNAGLQFEIKAPPSPRRSPS
jgi:predicted house-cleaning NTP pyrophosphatase (Maf/HAM1 superfamily)